MKLEINEKSRNYACTVVKLPPKQKVDGLDNLVKVTIFGNDILTQKNTDENKLYLFFPAESRLSASYLSLNNEYRHPELNLNREKKGFFEDSSRVKAIKFKGVISTGYIAPVDSLYGWCEGFDKLKEGDEFTHIDGKALCEKYVIKHVHSEGNGEGESKHNKKLKRFDKLVPNQFRFHDNTAQLAKNLHLFKPEDIICITDKFHGTSAVFANVLINKELDWKHRIAKFLGIKVVDKVYDQLYASRTVIKNQYINKEATLGYYNEDIWKVVQNEIKDKIEQGVTIYGEIVGYLPSGKMIQKEYDYGCRIFYRDDYMAAHDMDTQPAEHKFVVYRITYTKPDGNVIEYTWSQIKEYCKKWSLEHVKELYFGNAIGKELFLRSANDNIDQWRESLFLRLSQEFLEKDCTHCINKVPAEGIVIRIDGKDTYSAFKLKSKRFLEKETKELDKGEINIEDEQAISSDN